MLLKDEGLILYRGAFLQMRHGLSSPNFPTVSFQGVLVVPELGKNALGHVYDRANQHPD